MFSLQCIDKARDILDTELTAMVGESYSRAYGVSEGASGGARGEWGSTGRVRVHGASGGTRGEWGCTGRVGVHGVGGGARRGWVGVHGVGGWGCTGQVGVYNIVVDGQSSDLFV